MKTFKGHSGPVTGLDVEYQQKTPKFLLTCSWDKTIKKWDIESGACLYTSTGHSDFVKVVKICGDKFYTGSADSRIGVWDLQTGKSLGYILGHSRAVEDLVISPDLKFMFSCSSDNQIKKWLLDGNKEIATLKAHLTSVYKLYAVWNDDSLWSVSGDKTSIRWDLETNKVDATLIHPDFVKSITVLSNGQIATGCRDEILRIWDSASEKCLFAITAHYDEVSCIQASFDTIWSASLDGTIRNWKISGIYFF